MPEKNTSISEMEKKIEEVEKKLNIVKRFMNDNLEVKNQYIMQLVEESLELLKTINTVIKKKGQEKIYWSASDNLDIIIEVLNEKLNQIECKENKDLLKQLQKFQAIYDILKE